MIHQWQVRVRNALLDFQIDLEVDKFLQYILWYIGTLIGCTDVVLWLPVLWYIDMSIYRCSSSILVGAFHSKSMAPSSTACLTKMETLGTHVQLGWKLEHTVFLWSNTAVAIYFIMSFTAATTRRLPLTNSGFCYTQHVLMKAFIDIEALRKPLKQMPWVG